MALVGLSACKTMNKTKPAAAAKFPAFSTEGHRGGRGLMPENTIIAMKNAVDIGITTLEMDTHITKDGEVVVTHDDYLSPGFMLTPEGKEIPAADSKICGISNGLFFIENFLTLVPSHSQVFRSRKR